jgi:hypothetical protein
MSAIIPFGIAALGTVLGAGSVKKPNLIDPRSMGSDLIYGQGDIASDINMLGNKFTSEASLGVGQVKSAGAGGRLPEGAILSGIGGIQAKTAEKVSSILPALKREKRRSMTNYLDLVNKYETQKTAYDQAGMDRMLGGLGQLGKVATLWSAGLLN